MDFTKALETVNKLPNLGKNLSGILSGATLPIGQSSSSATSGIDGDVNIGGISKDSGSKWTMMIIAGGAALVSLMYFKNRK